MEKKTRFAILSSCTTLQKLQVFNNDQLKSLTDDFKEAEVRHILITQADASAVKTDRVLVSVQRDALQHLRDVWAALYPTKPEPSYFDDLTLCLDAGMPIQPLTPEEEDELDDTVFGFRLVTLLMSYVARNRSKDVTTRRAVRHAVQELLLLANVKLSDDDQRILDTSDDEILVKLEKLLSEADQKVVNLLTPIFKSDAACAREYFDRIQGLDSPQLINVTNEYIRDGKITTGANHKTLWSVLSRARLISTGERNWNTRIVDPKR